MLEYSLLELLVRLQILSLFFIKLRKTDLNYTSFFKTVTYTALLLASAVLCMLLILINVSEIISLSFSTTVIHHSLIYF